MAKENVKEEVKVVQEVDFVKLVKEAANSAMGQSSFIRVNLPVDITTPGLVALNKEYKDSGYEPFINGKHVLLLKN
jgi:hypothetical protein